MLARVRIRGKHCRVRIRGKHCALQPSLVSPDFGRIFTFSPNLRDCPHEDRGHERTRLLGAQNRFAQGKGIIGNEGRQRV